MSFRWDGIMFDVEAEEDLISISLDIQTWISVNYCTSCEGQITNIVIAGLVHRL
jgi:hypothetical protein